MVVSENYKFIEVDKRSVLFLDFLEKELKSKIHSLKLLIIK